MEQKVTLLDYFGNDLMVVNTARVSYGKETNLFRDKDAKLLNYLAKHKHTSPFRHPKLRFRIECPIYVERQIFKHQKGIDTNSISGRYVDFSDSYTTITQWRKQSKSSKQGSEGVVDNQQYCTDLESHAIDTCKSVYRKLLEEGVSKEQARTILPLNLNTKFIWTGSLQAFIHLCNLRLKPDAQAETRFIVQEMIDQVRQLKNNPFKYSLKAFDL